MAELRISSDLSLPVDAATQTFAFVGRKGSGKTYGAGKLVELLVDHGTQVVILDSVGNWYGLRLAADGRGDGIDIPILGGLRGDIPLEATGGALIADTIADSARSLVVDVSQFSKADRQRFATALAERLWQRKKAERNPSPVHLVIEEAQLIVPEQTGGRGGDTARMIGIYTEIIRLGRNYGIGVTMITQRPQSVSKEVLNQTECLMVFQVNGAHERKALKDWIVHQGMDTAVLNALPSLKPGDCFVWSPQWLEVLQRIHIGPKRTFDSTRTPKAGAGATLRRDPRALDLADLKAKMAATIERAKADDPKELKRKVAELERRLAAAEKGKSAPPPEAKTVDVPVIKPADLKRTEDLVERMEALAGRLSAPAETLRTEAVALKASLARAAGARGTTSASGARASSAPLGSGTAARPAPQQRGTAAPSAPREAGTNDGSRRLTGPEQRIVDAIAWLESIGVGEPEQTAVAFLAGYTYGGGAFNNPRGSLRVAGLVDYLQGDRIKLTDDGRALANAPAAPLTVEELHDRVLARLPGPEQRLLRPLLQAYPEALSNEDHAHAAGYEPGGGAYNNPRGRLRSLGLVEYPERGKVRARSILFLEE